MKREEKSNVKPKIIFEYKTLKCKLTPDEFQKTSEKLAKTITEIQDLELKKKSIISQFTSDINARREIANKCSMMVSESAEYRDVECQVVFDYKSGTVTTMRLDSKKIIEARPMRENEKQI